MIKIHHSIQELSLHANEFVKTLRQKSIISNIKASLNTAKATYPSYNSLIDWFITDYIDNEKIFSLEIIHFRNLIYEIDKRSFEILQNTSTFINYPPAQSVYYNIESFFKVYVCQTAIDNLVRQLDIITNKNGSKKESAQKMISDITSLPLTDLSKLINEKIIKTPQYIIDYALPELQQLNNELNRVVIPIIITHFSNIEKIFKCFNYKKYRKEFVESIVKNLNVNTCLYCNRHYISHSFKGKKRYGITLDHFYDKGTHPYFALSFYNLVLSCHSCNSSLKGTIPFCTTTHLHPYNEGFENILEFTIDADVNELIGYTNTDFDIILKPVQGSNLNDATKGQRNIKDFYLNEQYNLHKEEVRELLNLCEEYPNLKAPYQIDNMQEIERKTILRMILGVMDIEEFHKRPLSKLKRDIVKKYYERLLQ
ncbi:hypothetical protein V9L05_02295 [Bernardetia sp. Wsw4-3y2]|uniref:hypothetical protein n=1 Tax=Bernardetia sp. Wsw4-3y2 TaxID=3127471 RepID=UPI0030CE720E